MGFELLEKRIARHGNEVFLNSGQRGGFVTSGTFSPTLKNLLAFALFPLTFHLANQFNLVSGASYTELKLKIVLASTSESETKSGIFDGGH